MVEAITSEEYGAEVKRPAYSILDNYMLKLTTGYTAPGWKEAIKEYIETGWHLK